MSLTSATRCQSSFESLTAFHGIFLVIWFPDRTIVIGPKRWSAVERKSSIIYRKFKCRGNQWLMRNLRNTHVLEIIGTVKHAMCRSPPDVRVKWDLEAWSDPTLRLEVVEDVDSLITNLNLWVPRGWKSGHEPLWNPYLDRCCSNDCDNIQGAIWDVIFGQ